MKTLKFAALAFTAAAPLLFTACDKEDDDAQPTKTELLTRAEWIDSDFLIDGQSQIGSGFYVPGQNKFKFDKNGTYTNTTPDTTETANWKFIENETKIVFTNQTESDTVNVSVLTDSNFNMVSPPPGGELEIRFTR